MIDGSTGVTGVVGATVVVVPVEVLVVVLWEAVVVALAADEPVAPEPVFAPAEA